MSRSRDGRRDSLDEALRRTGRRAFQYAAWTNTLLWIWKDGEVVGLDPNDPNAELPEGFERPPPGPPPWVGLSPRPIADRR